MRPRVHTYHLARLSLLGPLQDHRALILEALRAGVTESSGQFKYGFFDTQELRHEGELFVFGRLVKYKHLLEGELVDEEAHTVMDGGLPDGVVCKANFLLHYASSIVAYRHIPAKLSDRQFRAVFARLIETAHHRFFVQAILESIDEDIDIMNAIQRLEIVDKITFDVRPTNPSSRDFYREIDRRLQELRAEHIQQTIEAKRGGFDKQVLQNDDSYRGVLMAADGYGTASIHGVAEGVRRVITTEASLVVQQVVDSEDPPTILQQIMSAFRRIWGRERT